MITPRSLLRLSAAGFWAFGLWAFVAPASMLDLVGVLLTTPAAGAEVRAYYGGLELGFGLFLWMSAGQPHARTAALAACSIYAGCAGGRVLGMLIEGSRDGFVALSGLGEAAGAAATWWAYRRL